MSRDEIEAMFTKGSANVPSLGVDEE
jgi:hypothetical protein